MGMMDVLVTRKSLSADYPATARSAVTSADFHRFQWSQKGPARAKGSNPKIYLTQSRKVAKKYETADSSLRRFFALLRMTTKSQSS